LPDAELPADDLGLLDAGLDLLDTEPALVVEGFLVFVGLVFVERAFLGLLKDALLFDLLCDELDFLRFFAAAFVSAIGLSSWWVPSQPIKSPDPVDPKRPNCDDRPPPARPALGTPSGGLPVTLPG
jgi:hypothetical protein